MSRTPRFIPSSSTGALVEVTYRTIQGRFLLRPERVLNEIVIGVLARAQSFCDAELIGIVVLSNHIHLLLSVPNQWHLSTLMQYFGGNAAREVNRLQDWRDSLWERRYTGIYVTEEPTAQIERLSRSHLVGGSKCDAITRRRRNLSTSPRDLQGAPEPTRSSGRCGIEQRAAGRMEALTHYLA